MLTEEELGRVCVVLVRARNPANIGAVARAMHDFGFTRLRVVNEFPVPFEAAKSAVDASTVMAGAASYESVADAIADCTLVVGTTAVGERDLQHELLPLAEAAPKLRSELQRSANARVALVFGSEKTGLSNGEMSHCNWLLTVPMWEHAGVRHPSMNLGQAVAVCLYEMVRVCASTPSDNQYPRDATIDGGSEPVDAAGLERITALLNDVMERIEYTRRHAASSGPEDVRRLVRRMGASLSDARAWMGFLRQVIWKLGGVETNRKADPAASLRDDEREAL